MGWFYNKEQERNYWKTLGCVLTLIILYCAVALYPGYQHQKPEACANQAKEIYDNVILTTPNRMEVPASEIEKNNAYRNEAKQQYFENLATCNDLNSQWWMAVITYAGIWVGAFGLLAIIGTLWQTFQAAKSASSALKVAQETLSETETNNSRQLRAYLGIAEVTSKKIMVPQGIMPQIPLTRPAKNPVTINITFKNVGQTPANNISIEVNLVSAATDNNGEPPEPKNRMSIGSMMPTASHALVKEFWTKDDWDATQSSILDGKVKIIVYGTIFYDDVFGVSHKSVFNCFLTGKLDGSSFIIGGGDSNYMT